MTEKSSKIDKISSNMDKPVPMKLFAAWEVDRTPPNCIPRLCSLTITRLKLLTPLPPELTSLSLAVKMQSSKRILRSHEIPVPQSTTIPIGNVSGGGTLSQLSSPPLLETDLDLHFSLQYPHFIKRDGNRLLLLLQRRKKYKTRTILGYKTLAEGIIRMDAVLQKSMDMTVELVGSGKAGRQGATIATLRAERVSSIPVDHDNKNNNNVLLTASYDLNVYRGHTTADFSIDRSRRCKSYDLISDSDSKRNSHIGRLSTWFYRSSKDRVNEYSDEDEEGEFSSGEENDEGAEVGLYTKRGKYRKLDRTSGEMDDMPMGNNPVDSDSEFENMTKDKGSRTKISQQRNFKQKIKALLKRFRVPEELDGAVPRGTGTLRGERELDALFQELESLSCGEGEDSGPDIDSLSIGSTPKPSLRPFFTNSRSMLQDNLTGIQEFTPPEKNDNNNDKKTPVITSPDRSGTNEWRGDSSGNEGGTVNTDPEAPNSDPQCTGSPPREKEVSTEKRNKLFRTSSNTPSGGKKKHSLSLSADQPIKTILDTCLSPTNVEPRKILLEQLSRTFATEETILPDIVSLIGPPEPHIGAIAPRLAPLLATVLRPIFSTQNTAEVRVVLQALMNKIQKYCNSTAKPPTTIKTILFGGDWLQGAVLRHYVDLLGVRPPDWVHHLRFYIIPAGSSSISRYLSTIDPTYSSIFNTDSWHQLCERAALTESVQAKSDIVDITNRIQRYVHSAGPCIQIPIAEAMVNYKDEDSCQIFVPFVNDVRIGCSESAQLSLDLEESLTSSSLQSGSFLSSSPPQSGRQSPPLPTTPASIQQVQEPLELQIDYWPMVRLNEKEKSQTKGQDQGKNSIKSTFRSLQVCRLPMNSTQIVDTSPGLTLNYATKEKKQKIMRLGKKKEKDRDMDKEVSVDNISRLICSPKQSHPVPLRVYIDGTEWTGVKFFQLSYQWQTHVKYFPVGIIAPMIPSELT